jgi:hypothetical protein
MKFDSMKVIISVLAMMLLSISAHAQTHSFGETIHFTQGVTFSVEGINITFLGRSRSKYPPHQKSSFKIEKSKTIVNVEYVHSGEVFPEEFTLFNNQYMLELDSALARGIPLEEGQVIVWPYDKWNKLYKSKLKSLNE